MANNDLNIVLIVCDTLRHDHLGCYGNSMIRTPNLNRFAAKSLIFERAYAASYPTMPARVDMLTGKYNFVNSGWGPLPRNEPTLPLILRKEAGYTTMAIVDNPFYVRNGYGYDRGFADFMWIRGQRRGAERVNVMRDWLYEEDYFAPATMSAAAKWIERHYKEKFFLLVDTFDPHEPWDPPGYYVEMYDKTYDGKASPWPCYWYWEETGMSEDQIKRAHAHYCGEVTMVDRWVGKLIERLESLDLLDRTAVIFTSDHGFYFGEHGIFGKAMMRSKEGGFVVSPSAGGDMKQDEMIMLFRSPQTGKIEPGAVEWRRSPLYDEVSHVPLIIYLPRTNPRKIDAMVSLPDLMPTILEIAGVKPPETVQALSLGPLLNGSADKIHDFIVTSWPLYNRNQAFRRGDDWSGGTVGEPLPSTITDGQWLLIFATEDDPVELYNVQSDPKLERNVFVENRGAAMGLHAAFIAFLEKMGAPQDLLQTRRRLMKAH